MNCIHKASRFVGRWRGQPVGRRTRGQRMLLGRGGGGVKGASREMYYDDDDDE
jgi:hypothetical protein